MSTTNELSALGAEALLERDLAHWPMARQNYEALNDVRIRTVRFGAFRIDVQFNPARIVSSGARTDAASISQRPCFLCDANRPPEQDALPCLDDRYLLLVNPFPIFRRHYTIVERTHTPQSIAGGRMADFLELARQLSGLTLLYNGPSCGASAPDHLHFQAVTRGQMPLDTVVDSLHATLLIRSPEATLSRILGCLRPLLVIRARTAEAAEALFGRVVRALPRTSPDEEPMMNLTARYEAGEWVVIVMPRRRHRPWEPGEGILTAPGAADMGGLFISVRTEDFEATDAETLRAVYRAVCPSDEAIRALRFDK